jgi:hypothetical protein
MRFFELNDPTDRPRVATEPGQAPVSDVKAEHPTDTPPTNKIKAKTTMYATAPQLKDVRDYLQMHFPDGKFTIENAKGTKQVPSIRARGISLAMLKSAMQGDAFVNTNPDAKQASASSSFPAYSFEKEGLLYTVVIGMKGVKDGDEDSIGISRKELTPTGLGIDGGFYDKNQLIAATKKAVESNYRNSNPGLADALIALVDSAAAGGTKAVDQSLMDHVGSYIGILSQDFGEILAPILILKPGQQAELPKGNEPLVDVKIPGMNLSVKALTGSGTSFRSISTLMDKYEASIADDDEDTHKKFSVLKQFHPGEGGNNKDKVIKAAAKANIPAYKEAVRKFGKFDNWAGLHSHMQGWPWREGTKAQYKNFLEQGLDVFTANWSNTSRPTSKANMKFVGMPLDGKYYLGSDGAKPPSAKEKAAGYASFRANPAKTAADIITYSLGVALLNYIKGGKDSAQYSKMMTDIVNKADAVIGHITVNQDGTMSLKTKPFSTLQFQFQYHAPSHIPGNNLPGFIALLD